MRSAASRPKCLTCATTPTISAFGLSLPLPARSLPERVFVGKLLARERFVNDGDARAALRVLRA